jgi:NAD(P)-dependent dehydrogenase (short-subunit alcohol dehydrogenase family)
MKPALTENMSGKIVLVTGATGGIGKEIARGLARLGATIVIGARTPERGERARDEIAKDTGNNNISVMKLDVADQASIRAFAAAFKHRYDKLHVLVNNAGAWFSDRRESPDGIETTLATNVVGPHLLTSLLVEPLKAAAPSRVVNVVSDFASNYDVNDLQFSQRKYDGFKAYGQAKQALRMVTFSQATKLAGTGITVNAGAPGFVKTDLNQNAHGFMASMINFSSALFAVSPAEGADTLVWMSVAPELADVTGKFFAKRKEKESKFREPGPLAELDKACEQLESKSASVSRAASASVS